MPMPEPEQIDPNVLLHLGTLPQSSTVDGRTVQERSIADLIALDNHLRARIAEAAPSGNGWGQIGIARAIPPGTTGNG